MALPLELWLVHPDQKMCNAFDDRFRGLPNVSVMQSRFEELGPHDCFVTAANSFGIMNAGIDAVVVRFHGVELMNRIQFRIKNEFLGEQPIGTAIIEPTGNPDYPYIAHAPTMRVPGTIEGTDKVYVAMWAALLAIYQHNVKADAMEKIKTAVFPAMGAGFGRVPYPEVARQMATAYRHYLDPPHRFDWDMVAKRHKAIMYDGQSQVAR